MSDDQRSGFDNWKPIPIDYEEVTKEDLEGYGKINEIKQTGQRFTFLPVLRFFLGLGALVILPVAL